MTIARKNRKSSPKRPKKSAEKPTRTGELIRKGGVWQVDADVLPRREAAKILDERTLHLLYPEG